MMDTALTITELSLSPATEIPKTILAIIENSLVYSINELSLAKKSNKKLYIASIKTGELIGYCIITVAYPHEVAEDLKTSINDKILWVDVLEIANLYQGNDYARALIGYIRNRYSHDLLLLSTEEAICFWQRMGLTIISSSGEMAYMSSKDYCTSIESLPYPKLDLYKCNKICAHSKI